MYEFGIIRKYKTLGGIGMSNLEKLRHVMAEQTIEALLVYSPYNLRYIANFTGTTGYALVTQEKAYFITDARYTEQAAKQAVGYEIVQNKGAWVNVLVDLVEKEQIKELSFEANHVTVAELHHFEEVLPLEVDLNPVGTIIETIREIKTEEELEIIRKACEISDKAFDHILTFIKPGVTTEIEVANELDFYMRSLGATGVSFDTIVASGYRSAMPHGVASDKVIQNGELLTMDYGCYYKGYVSDKTRTVAVGEISDQLKDIYQVTLDAQLLVAQKAKPGMTGADLDKIARDYITEKGYGEYFVHSLGHGIGLEIHEGPGVNRLADTPLVPGHVITNEPGIYLPGIGGVRIEDDMIVTETGVEVIQKAPKELITI